MNLVSIILIPLVAEIVTCQEPKLVCTTEVRYDGTESEQSGEGSRLTRMELNLLALIKSLENRIDTLITTDDNTTEIPDSGDESCDHPCPDGTSPFSDSCYMFFSGTDKTETYSGARAKCKEMGGYLATVTSMAESKHLLKYLEDTGTSGRFFIGLTDTLDEGSFIWDGGPESGEAVSFTNWNAGEPSGGSEDCVEMNYGYGRKWNDISCNHKLNYVCEYPACETSRPYDIKRPA